MYLLAYCIQLGWEVCIYMYVCTQQTTLNRATLLPGFDTIKLRKLLTGISQLRPVLSGVYCTFVIIVFLFDICYCCFSVCIFVIVVVCVYRRHFHLCCCQYMECGSVS